MDEEGLTCELYGWTSEEAERGEVTQRLNFDWYRAKGAARASFSLDVEVQTGRTDMGHALDEVRYREIPVLRALALEKQIEVDVALWFAATNRVSTAVFPGDWLRNSGRSFEIWAEVSHSDTKPNPPNLPTADRVVVEWKSGAGTQRVVIAESVTSVRQQVLENTLAKVVAQGAAELRMLLYAEAGIAGVVVPANLVQGLGENRTKLEIFGTRLPWPLSHTKQAVS